MNRALTWALLGSIALLLLFSAYLAATRIYQVDECQNIYMARILAIGQAKTFITNTEVLLLPLSWLARETTHSNDLFTSAGF